MFYEKVGKGFQEMFRSADLNLAVWVHVVLLEHCRSAFHVGVATPSSASEQPAYQRNTQILL